jgi:hypothetical protein
MNSSWHFWWFSQHLFPWCWMGCQIPFIVLSLLFEFFLKCLIFSQHLFPWCCMDCQIIIVYVFVVWILYDMFDNLANIYSPDVGWDVKYHSLYCLCCLNSSWNVWYLANIYSPDVGWIVKYHSLYCLCSMNSSWHVWLFSQHLFPWCCMDCQIIIVYVFVVWILYDMFDNLANIYSPDVGWIVKYHSL